MNPTEDTRRPEQIEDHIARTRADVSSTIDAIQEKLTPGQMMDQAIRYLRSSGAGDFGTNLGRQVRDNPLPVALIGLGVAWLAMGGRMRTELSPWSDAPPMRSSRVSSTYATDDAGGVAGTSYEDDWSDDETGAALDEPGLGERVAQAGSSAGERVRDTMSSATSRAKGGLSSAAQRARDLAHDAGERIGGMREGVRRRAGSIRGTTRVRVDRARDRTMRMIDEQPLVLGAIGVAIGAAIGTALPATRREDELLGGTRDGLLEGAGEVAREGMRDVASSARRVARTARERVERTPDTAPPADDDRSSGRPASTDTAGLSGTSGLRGTMGSGGTTTGATDAMGTAGTHAGTGGTAPPH